MNQILEETAMKELSPDFNQEVYRKILWKWQKRKARGKIQGDCRKRAYQEFCEVQKEIALVASKPLTEQSHLVVEPEQPHEPQSQQEPANLKLLLMAKRQLKEDDGDSRQSNAVNLW
jgi:hypothetical protein